MQFSPAHARWLMPLTLLLASILTASSVSAFERVTAQPRQAIELSRATSPGLQRSYLQTRVRGQKPAGRQRAGVDRHVTPALHWVCGLALSENASGYTVQCNLYSYAGNNPVAFTDPTGTDAVYVAFPDYVISANGERYEGLGHAGVLLIDNKTGHTRYYEYGRYTNDVGNVERRTVPDVVIGKDEMPTSKSLARTMAAISRKGGHGTKIEGAYVKNDNFAAMVKYAESREALNADPERQPYSIWNNNCGSFARDTIAAGDVDVPWQFDPRPNSYVTEMQDEFSRVAYDPQKGSIEVGGESYDAASILEVLQNY